MAIHPLFLGNGEHIEVEQCEKESPHPAVCSLFEHGEDRAFLITLYTPCIAALYHGSWVKDTCSLDDFTLAFLLHEMTHIRYQSFSCTPDEKETALFVFLDNLLEDARVEFQLMREFPGLTVFVHYALGAVREALELEEGTHPLATRIQTQVRHLYNLVRFGAAHDDLEQELLSLALPLILSATRGSRENAVLAARTLERYLLDCCRHSAGAMSIVRKFRRVVVPASRKPDGAQVLGAGATMGTTTLSIDEPYNDFVEKTCRTYDRVIRQLRTSFRLLFHGVAAARSYDGELSPLRQMEAYVSSLLGEEHDDYHVRRLEIPETDVVLVGDVSGSTSELQVPYAEAKVVLLAALANLPGIYPSALDFSDTAEWVCRPGERLECSKVGPRVSGGTQPAKALDLLEHDMRWRGKGHLVFWITDGDWAEYTKSLRRIECLRVEKGVRTVLLHCTGQEGGFVERREAVGSYSLWECTLETLPDIVSMAIAEYRQEVGCA